MSTYWDINHLWTWRYRLCKAIVLDQVKNMHTNSSSFNIFLPPSLEWGLWARACVLLHMAQSAPRRLSSWGSRCPGPHLELLTRAVQSPWERSNLPRVERCCGVGMTKCPGVKNRHQKAEGTLGPRPGPKKAQDPRRSHTHLPRCQMGKGHTHHHHHLEKTVSMWGRCSLSLW